MQTLAPRDLYDGDELGRSRRLPGPLATGMVSGGWIALSKLAQPWGGGVTLGDAAFDALLMGGIAGALFGWMMPRTLGRITRRGLDRWYAGDPAAVAPPAEGYSYRLPCWMLRGASTGLVIGVLYLGPRGLRFDPVLRTPPALRESLIVEPLRDVRLDLVQTPLPRLLWTWRRRTLARIRVRWPGGEARFGIPSAPGVLATLQGRVRALNDAAAAGG